jgi:hypothetical protein
MQKNKLVVLVVIENTETPEIMSQNLTFLILLRNNKTASMDGYIYRQLWQIPLK